MKVSMQVSHFCSCNNVKLITLYVKRIILLILYLEVKSNIGKFGVRHVPSYSRWIKVLKLNTIKKFKTQTK